MLSFVLPCSIAVAATHSVGAGQPHATVGAALAVAVDGDVIEVHPGLYDEALVVNVAVRVVGVGGRDVTTLTATGPGVAVVRLLSSATLEGLTLEGAGKTGVRLDAAGGAVLLREVAVRGANDAVYVGRPMRLAIVDSRFEDNQSGVYALRAGTVFVRGSSFARNGRWYGALTVGDPVQGTTVLDSVFEDNTAVYGGAIASTSGAPVEVSGCRFERNRADFGGAISVDRGDAEIVGNRFFANEADTGGAILAGEAAAGTSIVVRSNLFVDNFADGDGGAVAASEAFYGLNPRRQMWIDANTFVANGVSGGGGWGEPTAHVWVGPETRVMSAQNNLFSEGYGGPAWFQGEPDGVQDYNLWWDNTEGDLGAGDQGGGGPNDVHADPRFVAWSNDGDHTNDDFRLAPGSPAIDAGNPALLDRDGTRSDLGFTSGR